MEIELPPYMRAKKVGNDYRYYWEVSARIKAQKFHTPTKALGKDLVKAIQLHTTLANELEDWRNDLEGKSKFSLNSRTLSDAIEAYLKTDYFTKNSLNTQRTYRQVFNQVLPHVMRSGKFAGRVVGGIDLAVVSFPFVVLLANELLGPEGTPEQNEKIYVAEDGNKYIPHGN